MLLYFFLVNAFTDIFKNKIVMFNNVYFKKLMFNDVFLKIDMLIYAFFNWSDFYVF